MARSPEWKVYDSGGEYIAACKHVEDAAALVAFRGVGSTIRLGHGMIMWTEGPDGEAGESYDRVVEQVAERVELHHAALRERRERIAAESTRALGERRS